MHVHSVCVLYILYVCIQGVCVVHMNLCMCVFYVCVYVCIMVHMCVCVCACMRACIYVYGISYFEFETIKYFLILAQMHLTFTLNGPFTLKSFLYSSRNWSPFLNGKANHAM